MVPPEVLEGMALSRDQARDLEAKLDAGLGDAADRTRLIGYYGLAAMASPEAAYASAKHILTLAFDHPEAEVLGTPFGLPANEAAMWELDRLWRRHIEAQPRNAKVLENAARFFSQVDRPFALHLRYRLQLMDRARYEDFDIDYPAPQSPEGRGPESLAELEEELLLANADADPERAFHGLVRLGTRAYSEGAFDRAREAAHEVLAFSRRFEGDWDHGNAVHDAHLVLGLLALEDGQPEEAARHLLRAGETPGSPQLASFGPDMTLAKRLLEAGARGPVLEYLRACRRFWSMGAALLDAWEEDVAQGRTPNFLGNLRL